MVVPIARVGALTRKQFARDYLQGVGMPVVVTDATRAWPARTKWSFEYLKAAYGDDLVCPELGLHSGIGKITRLAAYIDYLDAPDAELGGFWTNAATGQPVETTGGLPDLRPYLLSWKAFQRHPELCGDINLPPYFVADWTAALNSKARDVFEKTIGRIYSDVFVGPAGSLSALHYDFGHTYSCLSQIRGTKRALLFSPEDSAFLYDGQLNPEIPDLQRFPLFNRATAYEALLQPGDVLFTPPDWWHHVRTIETSITVSHNFFNGVNCVAHLKELLRRLWARV